MNKFIFFLLLVISVTACSKKDPVLPGIRYAVFESDKINVLNKDIVKIPDNIEDRQEISCSYIQDSSNVIWKEQQKIFTGFATSNSVSKNHKPVCSNGFIYAGLTTGEVIKLSSFTYSVEWVADVYKSTNVTGGSDVLDIVADLIVDKGYVYAGGLGGAFCKLNVSNGNKLWCLNLSVGTDFILVSDTLFVVDTDNFLYAIDTKTGDAYWKTFVKKQLKPVYKNKIITVGKQTINVINGNIIKS